MSRIDDRLIDAMPSPGDMRADQRAAAIARVQGRLAAIAASFAELADQHDETTVDAMTEMGIRSRQLGKWTHDPIADALPAGPMKRASGQPPVSGSRERPAPVDLDVLGLTGPANAGSVLVLATTPWPKDQTGHLAVASELDFWACDWASRLGHQPPAPNVADLCAWLDVRLEWAYDEFAAWDEMAAALDRVARALYGTLSPRQARSVPVSAPCPREGCGATLSRRADGWIECGNEACGSLLSEAEYTDWSRIVIQRRAVEGWGVTAKEISLTTGKPMSTIHRWAGEYAWTRTSKEHRPVLYAKTDVAATLAKVAEREAREAATRRVTLEGQTCADLR